MIRFPGCIRGATMVRFDYQESILFSLHGAMLRNEARYTTLVGSSLGTTVESIDGQVLFT